MKKIKEIITSRNDNPDVSIIVFTYNHENYIENCLNSILEQETQYSVELIIHDDCSTDDNLKKINNSFLKNTLMWLKFFKTKIN